MKINEISVWKSRKIQIERYEPYDFSYGMKAEVEEGDDPNEVREELEKWVDKWLEFEVQKFKQPKKAMRNELFDKTEIKKTDNKPLTVNIDGEDMEVPF